ncbi:unnamed protein product [Bursaphelenchus okinawaensis]|uniref:Hydrolase_4 domain-containing protein n=1 Tax=Bursaphelenchus okinawaensis TaxID=465554 RepID=A0A811KPW0_9BILA|nr:unnamed protein product [Bursaphelenchus okinawaensis]CAG9110753.1 unnamed protein product [Bursaphelenchus okinawaensis]
MTGLRVVFCHGLGAIRNNPLAISVNEWARKHGMAFENVFYDNYGNPEYIWHVDDWRRNIRQRLHPASPALLISNSAGTQAALRAALDVPTNSIVGLAAFAPAVCVDLDYMDKIRPGTVQRLKDGKECFHPCVDKSIKIKVNLENLQNFVENCVCRLNPVIPIPHPVRLVHGFADPLVHYTNSIKLLKQLETQDKSVELVNASHFITDSSIVYKTLDSLMESVLKRKTEDEMAETVKKRVMMA